MKLDEEKGKEIDDPRREEGGTYIVDKARQRAVGAGAKLASLFDDGDRLSLVREGKNERAWLHSTKETRSFPRSLLGAGTFVQFSMLVPKGK